MATTTGSKRLLNISSEAMAASNSMTYGGLNVATEQFVSTQVSNLISSAPGTLDTLNELAAALGDDPNFATTITNSIATKLDASVNPLKAASVSNDTITFTRADNTTFSITTSDANTDTNYYLNGITRSGNTLTFSVSGTTNRTYTFGSAAWSATSAFDSAGSADAVNSRIDSEIIPLIDSKADASHTHSYLPLAGGTITGGITISGSLSRGTYTTASQYHTGADNIVLKGNASGISGIFFESEKNGTNINHSSDFGYIQYHPYGTGTSGESNELVIGVSNDSDDHVILNAPNANGLKFRVGASNTDYTIWHSGNDGSGSGLHADLLDGKHASTTRNSANTIPVRDANGYLNLGWINTTSGNTTNTITDFYVNTNDGYIRKATKAHVKSQLGLGSAAYVATSTFDAAGSADSVNQRIDEEVLPAIPTNNNELTNGAGYITDGNTNWNNTYGFIARGDTQEPGGWTSATKFKSSGPIADSDSGSHSLQVISDNGNDAFMSFHVSGDYAVFFGLDGGTNRLHTGGWSAGSNQYMLWDSRDFSSTNISNWNTAYAWGNHASAGYAAASHNHDSVYTKQSSVVNLGTVYFSASPNTAEFIAQLDTLGCLAGNKFSTMKVAWDYAGNSDLDTGSDTIELAGCQISVVTDNGGRPTVTIIRPTTGAGGGSMWVYNDQGSSYAPGWRQIWNSSTFNPASYLTTSGKAADANLLDGINSSSFLRSDANDSASGNITFSGTVTHTGNLVITEDAPTISFLDTSSGADDFYIHVNSNNFYVLRDTAGANTVDGGWDSPHPLQLEGDTNKAYIFGNQVKSAAYAATSAFDSAGSASTAQANAIAHADDRIENEVLPAIGDITLASLGFTGATNANYITNNNQLTNGAGYITSADGGNAQTLDGINSTGFVKQLGDTTDPNYQVPSSRRVDPNANNPTNHHYAITTFGNGGNVTGQLATHFQTGKLYSRGYNASWSAWNAYATEDYANTAAISYAGLVDTRINEEVLPAIPTNNNQLTNGAGYLTSVPTTLSGNRTIGGDLTVSGNQVITAGSNADVKFSVWSGTTYGIGMTSGVTYGGLNDYAMTFCMNNDSDRGFWWGYSGQSKSSGAMSLTTGGILTVASSITAGGDITAFSDARVKENIGTIDNALDKVTQLRGVEYNRIGAEERSIGVIAQEVQEVLPEVVREGQDGMLSVAYGNITGVLIEAIKEQQKQIEELKAQLDGLTK